MEILVVGQRSRELVAARFTCRRREVSFVDGQCIRFEQNEDIAGALGQISRLRQGAERIVLAPQPSLFSFRETEITLRDRKKLRQVLPLELRGETAVEGEELLFEGIPLDSGALALWIKKGALSGLIASFSEAGWEPEIVTMPLLYRNYLLSQEPPAGTCAVADLTGISVFRGDELIYLRSFRSGGWPQQVERTLRAVEHGKGLKDINVFTFAQVNGEIPSGLERLNASYLPTAPFHSAEFADLFAVASAVAAGDVVNFRHSEFAYTAKFDEAKKGLRLSAVLAALLVLLLFAEAGVRFSFAKHDLTSLNQSISKIYREAFPTRKKAADEVGELKAELRRLGGAVQGGGVLRALRAVAETKGDGITGFYEAEVDGNSLKIKGDARSSQAVTDMKAKLSSFMDAEVSEIKSLPDGSVSFILRGTLKGVEK